MLRKRVGLLLVAILVFVSFAACAQKAGASSDADGDPVEITWFRPQANRNAIVYWNDALWVQELEKRLNVKINFEGPLVGPTTADYIQAVQILLNSGDYPDILFFDWANYSGGLAGAVEDGVVLNVSASPEYWDLMTNWRTVLDNNELIRKSATLDDGSSVIFGHVEETTARSYYNGYAIRGDILEQVGKEVPTTIDELYDVFVAIKAMDESIYPLTDESSNTTINNLLPAWGMKRNNTVPYPDPDTGKITFWTSYKDGEAFTDFVTTMNKWYNEGLIDPDFASQDWDGRTAKMTTSKSVFSYLLPQQYTSWKNAIITGNPELEGIAYFYGMEPLIGPAGKKYNTNNMNNWVSAGGNVVTVAAAQSGKAEAALRVIDYLYSPEGTDLISWGVEGVSYTVNADGKKEWSELVTNDPDFSFGDAVFKYALPTQGDWPKIMSYEAWLDQETVDPDARRAHENYLKSDPSLGMPNIRLTQEESEAYNQIMTDIKTLIDENFINFITGVRPLSDVPVVLQQIEDMGINEALAIYQGAYDRYQEK